MLKIKSKMLSVVLLLCLSTQLSAQGTVSEMPTTLDSIYYTEKQDLKCLECLINESKKDSIVALYKQNEAVCDTLVAELNIHNSQLKETATTYKVKLARCRRWLPKVGVIFFFVGFGSGVIVAIK